MSLEALWFSVFRGFSVVSAQRNIQNSARRIRDKQDGKRENHGKLWEKKIAKKLRKQNTTAERKNQQTAQHKRERFCVWFVAPTQTTTQNTVCLVVFLCFVLCFL